MKKVTIEKTLYIPEEADSQARHCPYFIKFYSCESLHCYDCIYLYSFRMDCHIERYGK